MAQRRRRRFAELEQLPEEIAEPALVREEEPESEPEEEDGLSSPEDVALKLQRTVGNRALTRLLVQRFALPGGQLDLAGVDVPGLAEQLPDEPGEATPGLAELAGADPGEHVASFLELAESLPGEAKELLTAATEAIANAASGGPTAAMLLAHAKENLAQMEVPDGDVTNANVLLEKLCHGVGAAWEHWQQVAVFTDVLIMGPTALGGELKAPQVSSILLGAASPSSVAEIQATAELGRAFDEALKDWSATVKFPGLPLYPAFAAFPSPMAPPTPNIPFPLAALAQSTEPFARLSRSVQVQDPAAAAVVQAVAGAISGQFSFWTTTTVVTNLLGSGPIPTYAPPYVPVGPVVGGNTIPIPGSLRGPG